ncbi:hypothetical protein [Aliidiomarina quisquiliarum]|uniref:hypothetical protein n=1 Tax=Aliidiomarina quisquiliarum TaxID=2938947 RepID=UPI00208E443C|nr:hypothetical protein [Aliidiomarina quisquiliarum]MCO4321601.1 hypothetical protein [Aliidiomarina quisquiliarum]
MMGGGFGEWFLNLSGVVYFSLFVLLIVFLAAVYHLYDAYLSEVHKEQEFIRKRSERDFLLRRDVYLSAAEAIARAQEFLTKTAGLDLNRQAASQVVDHVVGALGRVHLVASERTLKATMAFSTELDLAYIDLMARKQPLVILQNEIESLDRKISQLAYERDNLLASLTRLASDEPEQHGSIWSEMNLRFDKLHRDISKLGTERCDKVATLARLRREFSSNSAKSSLKLAKLGIPLYLAFRAELGLPLDELDYRGLATQNFAEIEKALRLLDTPTEASSSVLGSSRLNQSMHAAAMGAAAISAAVKPQEARLKMVLGRKAVKAPV